MKNSMKNLLALTFLVVFIGQASSQGYRRVDWLHGMGGGPAHWSKYSAHFGGAFGTRQMNSTVTSYTASGSINAINASINTIPGSLSNNIGIGHSLGGIVCRNFEANGTPVLDGIITVHSPNQGASIATAVNNGSAEAFLNEVCSKLVAALRGINDHLGLEIYILNALLDDIFGLVNVIAFPFTWLFGETDPLITYEGITIPSPNDIESQIAMIFAQINNPGTASLIDDLDPTTGFIDNLNNYNGLPRIEVHGYEINHETMRLACSRQMSVWTAPLAQTVAIPDDCIITVLNNASNKLGVAKAALVTKGILVSSNIFRLRRTIRLWNTVGDVEDAQDLLDFGLESGFEDLIGTQWVPVTTTAEVFSTACQSQVNTLQNNIAMLMQVPGNGATIANLQNQILAIENDPDCYAPGPFTHFVPVDNSSAANDGFILESEMTTGSADKTYQNVGVNHMEVLNHPEMLNHFKEIFDAPTFFNTPPR